jgi:hypothetical protein
MALDDNIGTRAGLSTIPSTSFIHDEHKLSNGCNELDVDERVLKKRTKDCKTESSI